MADISIITPVLNQVEHIEKCILSVAEQDVDVEHIIIDGGSTDGTVEIIKKHENKLSFWISGKDEGQSHAINKGLKYANGLLFNWLNADDRLTIGSLATINSLDLKDSDVIIGKCEHIDSGSNKLSIGHTGIWESLEATIGNYSMGQPSLFYRTQIVKDLGGLNTDLHYCMDMDLWFRYLLKFGQERITTTDQILSRFLVHSHSKSVKAGKEMEDEKYGLYHALFSMIELPDVVTDFYRAYPIPTGINYDARQHLNYKEILANFCWHLMQKAYEENNVSLCKEYFEIVKTGAVLSKTEKLKWKARIKATELLRG